MNRHRSGRTLPGLKTAARVFWFGAVLAGVPGLVLQSPIALSVAAAFAAAGFVAYDVADLHRGGITAITMYSFIAFVIGVAHVIALRAADTPERIQFFLYMADEYIYLATQLALAGAVIPVLAFYSITRNSLAKPWVDLLPTVRGRATERQLIIGGVVFVLIAMALRLSGGGGALGTVSSSVAFAPHFVSFALARMSAERGHRGGQMVALGIAVIEATRAMLFDYLRSDIASAIVAYAVGTLIGARSMRPLVSKQMIPVYAFGAIFVLFFGTFGSVRSASGTGAARAIMMLEEHELAQQAIDPVERQTVVSRMTTLNQLSQVGRVVHEDGFLEGETLEYLAYAFIPRAIWPEKPAIAKGAWFALRIGQANLSRDGRISNSVNMTIPGELYLNFGWSGVFLGCWLFGTILGVLWSRTEFWSSSENVLGSAFGFYLLWVWVGLTLGADLQILVTMIAMYLMFVGFRAALNTFRTQPARIGATGGSRPPAAKPRNAGAPSTY